MNYMQKAWEVSLKIEKAYAEEKYTDKDGRVWLGIEGDTRDKDCWLREDKLVSMSSADMKKKMINELMGWDETPVEDPYEYAVQVHQDDPNRWVVIGRILAYGEEPYWGSKVTMEEHIERQREYWTDRTFRLVRRVKAGRIENV